MRDVWEISIIAGSSRERIGYPTQKPLVVVSKNTNELKLKAPDGLRSIQKAPFAASHPVDEHFAIFCAKVRTGGDSGL